ncbi:MAG: right-handed parallel beta-helix repeat-containing protein [Bacillota bacterium]|nr:right-handed parallel beta-helix repeat-containing protein [Bacillota bacterium]
MHSIKNNFATRLTEDITSSQLTMKLDIDPSLTYPYWLTIGKDPATGEIVEVTGKTGADFTIARGTQSTIAQAFPAHTRVQLLFTKGHVDEMQLLTLEATQANWQTEFETSEATRESTFNAAEAARQSEIDSLKQQWQDEFNVAETARQTEFETTKQTYDTAEAQRETAFAGMVHVDANLELSEARNGESTLKARLDKSDSSFNSHLAENAKIYLSILNPMPPLVGAKGDGTNETSVIQTIIDSMPDGAVLVAPNTGNVYLTDTLTINKDLILCGGGVFKLISGKQGDLFVVNGGQVTFENLTFDYNGNVLDYNEALIKLNTNGCTIKNCTFIGGGQVYISATSNHVIKNNTFNNAMIRLVGETNYNIVDGNKITPPTGLNAISQECVTVGEYSIGNQFTHNTILNCQRIGIELFSNGVQTIVSNNHILLTGSDPNGMGISLSGSLSVVVDGNEILRDAFSASGGVYGVELAGAKNCIITNNHIINIQTGIILNGSSISSPCTNNVVDENYIENSSLGISLFRWVDSCVVHGNKIVNINASSSCIKVERSDDANYPRNCQIISNNLTVGESGVSTNLTGINSFGLVSSIISHNVIKYLSIYNGMAFLLTQCIDVIVEGNHCIGASNGSGISSSGAINTNCIIRNNLIDGFKYGLSLTGDNNYSNLVSNNLSLNCITDPYALGGKFLNEITHKGKKIAYEDTTAPTVGTWTRGDKVYLHSPSAGGYIGYVCITSGSPGTWKGFGLIEA